MDPYLEEPEFGGLHGPLIVEMAKQLTARLRPRYVARMQKWFSVDSVEDDERLAVDGLESSMETYPDVAIVKEGPSAAPGTGAAVLSSPLELQTVLPRHVPQHSLEIRDVAQRRLVTVIELLSPSNKRGDGREQYLERRSRFLRSSAHLMEIDLLRRGRRVPMRQALPAFPYFVFLSRAGRRPNTQVWPIPLRSVLPEVPIPLLPGDGDASLRLQDVLNNVYDQLAYDVSTDYTQPPAVALTTEDIAWAQSCVRTWRGTLPNASSTG